MGNISRSNSLPQSLPSHLAHNLLRFLVWAPWSLQWARWSLQWAWWFLPHQFPPNTFSQLSQDWTNTSNTNRKTKFSFYTLRSMIFNRVTNFKILHSISNFKSWFITFNRGEMHYLIKHWIFLSLKNLYDENFLYKVSIEYIYK